jgi:hypothetical protein
MTTSGNQNDTHAYKTTTETEESTFQENIGNLIRRNSLERNNCIVLVHYVAPMIKCGFDETIV